MKIDELSYEHQQAIQIMMPQLLIVLLNRLGGTVDIPVDEIDGTGKYMVAMRLDPGTRTFHFVVKTKGEA